MSDVSRCGVLVVEDDGPFRAVVAETLTAAGFDVTEAPDAAQALAAAERTQPALVFVDVNLPGTSGYALCRDLRERYGDDVVVAFLSGERTEPFDRVAGLLIGADDYLVKPLDPDELVARARALVRRMRRPARNGSPLASLTPRELEVLRLLADGQRQPQIAQRLVISPRTVGTHIEHILEKLGAHSRAEAVAVAYREDLFGSPAEA
jgi:DNA-binding NarL/FixJ family response regulator